MNKLLNKSLKSFTIYALLVLASSVPAYYYLVDSIWLRELDEHNEIIANRTEKELNNLKLNETELNRSVTLWNKIKPGTNLEKIILNNNNKTDSIYTILRKNIYVEHNEIDRFRGLSRVIKIKGENYLLTVETNVEETEETAIAIAILTFLFFLILVVGFLILNKRLSIKLWQPFRNTLSELKTFNLNAQSKISFEKSNILEFEELNVALNKLIEHTVSVYKSQKEFTENASHELQTPLAIIKNKLDILLQKEALTDRQYQIIEDINKALTRVSRINKNLLLLAKIENHQFDESETINLSELTEECLKQLQEHFSNKELSVNTSIEKDCVVTGNRVLIEVLINNLLLNSIRHNSQKGIVEVKLNQSGLFISNSGIKTLEKEHLFKRFKKSSEESSGSGLGLAIVEQICKRHQWTIGYEFQQEKHTFKISF
ncbi:sensor histidine kinase [Pedobacter glucosidilyticus]|uniref:sensor histidine kinase n=1 Tax=Pedobacter glucosidilyticus TaxID=1122941 RepID=UPI0004248773|nr:HAMP domain-containing sensor histidine kinase [Pedobacter glucosidilyticus]